MRRWGNTDDPVSSSSETCSIADCDSEIKARDLCGKHLRRWYKHGDPSVKLNRWGEGREYKKKKTAPLRQKEYNLRRYGMTLEQYNSLLAKQDGKCAICSILGENLSVDHDHRCCPSRAASCGKCIRGLLCISCNSGLGRFRDNSDLLAVAIVYLASANEVFSGLHLTGEQGSSWGKDRRNKIRRYGITTMQYDAILSKQGGCCAICHTTPVKLSLSVDHDHSCCPERARSCGKCVRGLLCENCNPGIGCFKDDPILLTAAITYLNAA